MTLCLFHGIQLQGELVHLISSQRRKKGRFSLRVHRKSMGTLESQVHTGCGGRAHGLKVCGMAQRSAFSQQGHHPWVKTG